MASDYPGLPAESSNHSAMRIIANGGAKALKEKHARDEFVQLIKRELPHATVVFTEKRTPVESLVKDAIGSGVNLIVAAGGDGTVNAVAAELVDTQVVLGVMPLGTLNHFAKDVGIPDSIEEAVQTLASGKVVRVDVGRVNDRIFVNNSGLGLYPEMVFHREHQQKHGLSKWSAALIESVRALKRYEFLDLTIEMDDHSLRRRTPAVFIGNNEYILHPTRGSQRENLDRGQLCLYMPRPASRTKLIWFCVRALFGNPKANRDFEKIMGKAFTISLGTGSTHVSVDGEVTTLSAPLKYESRPASLQVIVPSHAAERAAKVEEGR